MPPSRTALLIAIVLAVPAFTSAQTTFNVTSEAGLRTALTNAQNGDTIVFRSAITLTTGDLPSVRRNITIEGDGFSLSGNNQYRGLFVAAFAAGTATPQGVNVTIQNLTIQNTRAAGGAGGDGTLGGGGGAGLGGALFIANQATVTVNNVNFASNAAAGGSGGAFGGAGFSGGGGGGLGGNGGIGDGDSGAGGGGVGGSGGAAGGRGNNPNGGPGILTGAAPGGSSNAGAGGVQGGGGAVGQGGSSSPIPQGGAGGGAGGGAPSANTGAPGGFGGGGGGATATAGSVGAAGGFGGGGGGGTGGAGGFGGGGGGAASTNSGGFGGGAGSSTGGGGGAGMGGAIFVQNGGALNVAGPLNINGSSVSGGSGGSGGGSGSAFGAGVFLQGSGTLNFTPGEGQTQAVADTIADLGGSGGAGSWALAKNGAGTLVLSGANSFTGSVTVNDGTLGIASDNNLGGGGALRLNNAATLAISSSASFGRQVQIAGTPAFSIGGGHSVAWNGQITNGASVGALHVSGGGTLSLTNAANSYSGGTFVRGGSALAVTTDAVLGAASGGLTLGDATTAGTLRIADGTVFSSNRTIALGGGGAVIDTVGSSSATFGAGLSGSGGLTKNGTGTLTLNGGQLFTGPTAVLQGTFALNGSLPGSVVVYSAGTFRGAGTVGGSLTVIGTIVSPATSTTSLWGRESSSIFPQATAIAPSSLLVRGDLVVANGATLGLTLTSPSQTPLVVEGNGVLSGANLDLTVNDPNVTLARITRYNAITAAQGLSVVNTNITSNIGTLFPGLQPFFTLDRTTLGLTVVDSNVPLATVATNPNARAAGESIDQGKTRAVGDFAAVVRELSVLDDAKLDDALRSIAGEVHGTKIRLVALDAEAFTDVVRDEISSRERGTEEDRAANTAPQGERPQWWGQFAGQHADFETRDGADGADGNIGGAAFGVDWNFAGRWFAGGGGGYSRGTLTLDEIEASSRVTAPRVFGYAGFSAGPYSLNFGGSGAWTSYETRRHLAFGANLLPEPIPGGLDRVAEGTQDGTATDQWTEFSDNFKIRTWTYDAKVGWRHARYGRDAFKETGGQSLSLEAAAQAEHSWQADVRFKAFRNTGGIRPHFSGSYRRELGDADTTTEVQLADQPERSFAVEGLGFGKNTITGLGGVTVHSAAGVEYTLDYEARHAAGQTAQSVHFRLRY